MELFVAHSDLQEFNRKNRKQVFHQVCLKLAEQGELTVTRQHGAAPLLFSVPIHDKNIDLRKGVSRVMSADICDSKGEHTLTQKLEELAQQEAMLTGRENGLRMLIEFAPEKRELFEVEIKRSRYQRMIISACHQVMEEYGYVA